MRLTEVEEEEEDSEKCKGIWSLSLYSLDFHHNSLLLRLYFFYSLKA